ncbi:MULTISPECIES: DUF6912 family protein [Streptomyces]|uniref:DUF6912 family protein n=1 Tax=Streptomyces TaxID=1883 RepID=UPI000CD590D4|nr:MULTISPECIES: hypothetical protein [Streptomyces]
MRVYLPLTLPGLAELHRSGEVAPAPLTGYAVTPALREWYLSGTEEELEYAALGRAAQAVLPLLAADPGAPTRRVVVAVEVGPRDAHADPDRALDAETLGEVTVDRPVTLAEVAAVHVDADEAAEDVAAAVGALEAAAKGDEDARIAVDGAADHELLWYGVQEIDTLV